MQIKVTITSDFLCPWCYLGEVRLCKAVAQLGLESEVDLRWKPFELNPDMPRKGMERQLYRTRKFGSRLADQKDLELSTLGREEGVEFNFPAIAKACNTRLAHRLHRFAAERGKGSEYARGVFQAYFEQGEDIGELPVLLAVIDRLELSVAEARAFIDNGGGEAEVLASEAEAIRQRIHAVPHFRIGNQTVNGAQTVEVFAKVLLAARDSQQQAN